MLYYFVSLSLPLSFLSLSQGNGTSIGGHYINTGLHYIYQHNENLNRVTIQKVKPDFSDYDWSYNLTFEEERPVEVQKYISLCELPKNSCTERSFNEFKATTLKYFSENYKEHYNFTCYFKQECSVFLSHMGKPFDIIYFDKIQEFFSGNCVDKTHNNVNSYGKI
jgi:hypothetical protein